MRIETRIGQIPSTALSGWNFKTPWAHPSCWGPRFGCHAAWAWCRETEMWSDISLIVNIYHSICKKCQQSRYELIWAHHQIWYLSGRIILHSSNDDYSDWPLRPWARPGSPMFHMVRGPKVAACGMCRDWEDQWKRRKYHPGNPTWLAAKSPMNGG